LQKQEVKTTFSVSYHPMKRILAAGCFILALNSLSHVKTGVDISSPTDGRKVLIRAIAVIVNSEANRKIPAAKLYIPKIESPVA
jgi:hypothetical protein